jgi:hypothetical protein
MKDKPHRKVNSYVSTEAGAYLDTIAWYWGITKKEALERALKIAWENIGKPSLPPRAKKEDE